MTHTITAIRARQNLGEVLNRVSLKGDEFIIKRGKRPMAAVIPIEKLEQLQNAARLFLAQALSKNRAAGRGSSAADEALANEAKHRSRKRNRPVP